MPIPAILAAFLVGAAAGAAAEPADGYRYQDLTAKYGFPVAQLTLLGYVLDGVIALQCRR